MITPGICSARFPSVKISILYGRPSKKENFFSHSPTPFTLVTVNPLTPAFSSANSTFWMSALRMIAVCPLPESRPIQKVSLEEVIEIPEVGVLHHHYERRAA
jgi:hypothetical protein